MSVISLQRELAAVAALLPVELGTSNLWGIRLDSIRYQRIPRSDARALTQFFRVRDGERLEFTAEITIDHYKKRCPIGRLATALHEAAHFRVGDRDVGLAYREPGEGFQAITPAAQEYRAWRLALSNLAMITGLQESKLLFCLGCTGDRCRTPYLVDLIESFTKSPDANMQAIGLSLCETIDRHPRRFFPKPKRKASKRRSTRRSAKPRRKLKAKRST